jgi:folate-binding protein YgfZ
VIAIGEYELATESVGLVEHPDRALFEVAGDEAADFLQGQVSNDAEGLLPGTGCYATLLNHKGKIRADLRVLRTAQGFLLDTEPIAHRVLEHMLQTYSLGRQVTFHDLSGERTLLSLIGPAARDRLDASPPDEEQANVEGGLGLYVATDLGVDVVCSEPDEARATLGVEDVSEGTAECLRIESGRPRLGFDMDGDTIPEEAGLNERAVNFEKGCYVGQETVARLHYKGKPNRHLRGLRLSAPCERGESLRLGDREVGRLGSTCVSPTLGPIALALVRREASPGDTVAVGDGGTTAEVVDLPFRKQD